MQNILSVPRITRRAGKIWFRNFEVFLKTWKVNFFPPLIEALLYLFAIGLGLGTYVREIDGILYINFITPAILGTAVMNSAFFECTYGSYVRMYYQKSFDAMIATPLSIEDVIAGELLSAGLGMCFTAITPNIDSLNYPSFLFITPMTLFSGTFFPLTLMPVVLQNMAYVLLSLTHVVAVLRMLALPAFSWTILFNLAWIIAIIAILCIISINLMRRRLIV